VHAAAEQPVKDAATNTASLASTDQPVNAAPQSTSAAANSNGNGAGPLGTAGQASNGVPAPAEALAAGAAVAAGPDGRLPSMSQSIDPAPRPLTTVSNNGQHHHATASSPALLTSVDQHEAGDSGGLTVAGKGAVRATVSLSSLEAAQVGIVRVWLGHLFQMTMDPCTNLVGHAIGRLAWEQSEEN
jgi:hypothetical protein